MSEPPLKHKWRPKLSMVVFGVFSLVALLPLVALLLVIGLEQFFGFNFLLRSVGGFLTLAIGSVAMAAVIGAVFLRTLLQPLQALITRTAEIERGDADAFRPLVGGGTQEVATLGERFFRLAQRLSQRSNYLTLFTTHVSHELKTPLTSIQGAAELLREEGADMDPQQRAHFLRNIEDDTARLAELSTKLRQLARAEVANTGGSSFVLDALEPALKKCDLMLQADDDLNVEIAMSEENAMIVWQQLAENAKQHGATRFTVLRNGRGLKVTDDGTEISDANREQVFNSFFTTRREQGGTGMGLGIAQAMLRSHGGDITMSDDSRWKFEISLPV